MRVFQKIILWLVILACIFASGELFLRVIWTNPYHGFLDRFLVLSEPKPNTDLIFNWPWGPIRYRVDSHGFINPSLIYDNPDFTIAFLGGSTTECMAVDENKRFAYLVGKRLSERFNKRINSLNCGLSGANTQHMLSILLNKVRFYKPQVCVMMLALNDMGTLFRRTSYAHFNVIETTHITAVTLLNYLASRSHFFGLIRKTYMDYAQTQQNEKITGDIKICDAPNMPPTAQCNGYCEEFKKNLRLFIHICRDSGITPVLMTEAANWRTKNGNFAQAVLDDESIDCFASFNDAIRTVAREMNVVLIDMQAGLSNHEDFFYDGLHYTAAGSEKAAEFIVENLVSSSIVSFPQ